MYSSVSRKDEMWFLRVCHHISAGLYHLLAYKNIIRCNWKCFHVFIILRRSYFSFVLVWNCILLHSAFGFYLVLCNDNHSCCGVQLVWRGEDKVAPLYNDQLHSLGNGTNPLLLCGLCEPWRCPGHNGENERDPWVSVANLRDGGC
jgi:hypothetical protein